MNSSSKVEEEISKLRIDMSKFIEDLRPVPNHLFQHLSCEVRKELEHTTKNHHFDEQLTKSLKCRHFEIVKLLAEKCCVNLNEPLPIENDSLEETPLEYSVRKNDFRMLVLLVRLGADVRIPSSQLHPGTLLIYACKFERWNIVKFLINWDVAAMQNVSDLMGEFKDENLIKTLKSQIDVRAKDNNGNTALHWAVKRRDYHTMRLLFDSGAEPRCTNNKGDDVLRLACLYDSHLFAFCLLEVEYRSDIQRQIEAYQLLGAYYFDFNGTRYFPKSYAFVMWEKAIQLRMQQPLAETAVARPNPAYDSVEEAKTLEDLEELRNDENKSCMQALMLREKFIGSHRKLTFDRILCRAMSYWSSGDFERWFRLLEYAFVTSQNTFLTQEKKDNRLFAVCFAFEIGSIPVPNHLFSLVAELLERLILELIKVRCRRIDDMLKYCNRTTNVHELFHNLLLFFIWLDSESYHRISLKQLIIKVVKLDLQRKRNTLLAYFMSGFSANKILHDSQNCLTFAAIEMLLECGADVETTDERGNNLLHILNQAYHRIYYWSLPQAKLNIYRRRARLFLDYGVHVDARNDKGKESDAILRVLGVDIPKPRRLMCLAARVIRSSNIPFEGLISRHLYNFVKMH